MKRIKHLWITLICMLFGLAFTLGFTSCKDESPVLTEISVLGATEAYIDEFDYSDYTITATYDDSSTETITLISDYISQTDNDKLSTVGTHDITVTYQNVSASFTVTLKNHDFDGITFEDIETTYDGTEKTIAVTGAPSNATVTYDKETTYINAGTYTVTATVNLANYNSLELTATLTINKATYDMSGVVFNDNSVTYNGQAHNLLIEGNLPFGVSVSYENNNNANAGTYTVTANFTGDSNYNEIQSKTATLTINKATYAMDDISFSGNTVTYNGQVHSLAIEGNLPTGVSVSYENNNQINAGEYVVKAKFTGNENYNLIEDKTATLIINKATYDMSNISLDEKTVTYNGQEHSISIVGKLPQGVTVEYENNNKTDAGEYTVTAKFIGDTENYNLIENKTAKLTINKATYDMSQVVFEDKTVVYNGQKHSITATNFAEGITATYENNEQTDVGTYTVTVKFAGNKNYNTIENKTATLTINKATYDMSNVNFSDKTVTYNGQAQSILATNLPLGVTATYENNEKTDVGEYTVTVSFTGDSKNYNAIEGKTAKLTIIKASVSGISFSGKSFTYDSTKKNLAIAGELPEGVSVIYKNNEKTNAGTYTVTASFTVDENYEEIPDMTATLTINKATYDMSAVDFSGKTVTYNGNVHSLEVVNLPDGVTVEYEDNGQINAGRYIVTANFVYDFLNYNEISSIQALLIINKATYNMDDVSFVGGNFTYDGTPKSIYITGTLPTGVNVTYKNNAQTNAGSYTVTAEFTGDTDNYNKITARTATLLINKANYNMSFVRFTSKSFVYDGTEKSLAVSGTLPTGVSVSYANNGQINVNEYTVTAKFAGDENNYNAISDMTATLTITQATPFVEALCEQSLNVYSSVELIADTDVAGTIIFDTEQELVLGTNTYTWTFIPEDSHNYTNVSGTISLTVGALVQFYNDNQLFNSQNVVLNNSAVKPVEIPQKADSNGLRYTFAYWSLEDNGTEYSFTNSITRDTTLYAVYTSEEIVYNVYYYNTKNIEHTNVTQYTVSTEYNLLSLEKEHYVFNGWTDKDGNLIEKISIGTTGDLDLYAKWTFVEYEIHYELGYFGVDNSANQATYNVEESFEFVNAIYDEYHTFMGWYIDEKLTVEKSSISLGEYGEITLYAKWNFSGTFITNATELQNMAYNMSGAYELTNDIDLTNETWTAIGDSTNQFTGYFNGNDYSVTGKELFGEIGEQGQVVNVAVNQRLATTNHGYIENVHVKTAGLVDTNTGTVFYCSAEYTLITTNANGTVKYCWTNITSSEQIAGGLINICTGGIIDNCYSIVVETGTDASGDYIGGGLIRGVSGVTKIENCYVIYDSTAGIYGGLVAHVDTDAGTNVTINNCFAIGTAKSNNRYNPTIGGLVGTCSNNTTITNSFASMNLKLSLHSDSRFHIGYITGEGGNVQNCYQSSSISITGSEYGEVYEDGQHGIATSDYNLKSVTFIRNNLGWDEDIWYLEDGQYPKLRFELD